MSLKIKVHFRDRHKEWLSPLRQVEEGLRDRGLDLSAGHEVYDGLFLQHDLAVEEATMESEDRPVIIYERNAAATVQHAASTRNLLKHPRVVAWAKENTLRDPARQNAAVPIERDHYDCINVSPYRFPRKSPGVLLEQGDLAKIRAVMPMFALERYHQMHIVDLLPLSARKIDVMCGGTMTYDEILTAHRYRCSEAVSRMRRNTLVSNGYNLHANVFRDLMRLSKIVVSPFGWGAYSWKDYEVIYCGAILVKPRCDYMAHPMVDFYSDEFCVWCDPNFLDLEAVVENVIENMETYEEAAEKRLQKLRESALPEALTPHFETFFKGALEGS